jgi:hypothetical protein
MSTIRDHVDEEVEQQGKKSYADKVRSNIDTKNLPAIMGRFRDAMSWRN